jgi:hypothetical protein
MVRRGEQSGQMLVSVIVLLTLMFFIGSAMALAVSSSLHTIAQTNNTDSTAYAAESAVAQGLARSTTPVYPTPMVGTVLNAPTPLGPPLGCNNGIGGTGDSGDTGNTDTGNRDSGNREGSITNLSNVAPATSSPPTWSYAYEVVGKDNRGERDLLGRSVVGTGQGPGTLDANNYQTITIPHISVPGYLDTDISFEVYRTAGGDPPSSTGCITVWAQQPGVTTVNDSGHVDAAPPMCTRPAPKAPPLSRQVNNYGPGGRQGPLTASTCRVPEVNGSVQMWSAPAQRIAPGCPLPQPLVPSFSLVNRTGTIWGVIGWHAASAPKFRVSLASCAVEPKCHTRATAPGVLYYWCNVGDVTQTTTVSGIYILNDGGAASVNAFVVRASPSGTDCVATSMGQAGPVADEAAQQMLGCDWTNASKQTFWNRVLP